MKLTDFDLRQMNSGWMKSLSEDRLRKVAITLMEDLKEARDRLNMDPSNSSRPSGSMPPWEKSRQKPDDDVDGDDAVDVKASPVAPQAKKEPLPELSATTGETAAEGSTPPEGKPATPPKKKGKPQGAPGYGRTQKLTLTLTRDHYPETCACCETPLPTMDDAKAYTAWDEIDVGALPTGEAGFRVTVTRHRLLEVACPQCGHLTRAGHYHAPPDALWENTEVAEWRLVGPMLAAMIVLLAQRSRLSRRGIREFLLEFLGIALSVGTIDQTIRESARACAPLEDALVEDIIRAEQLYIDETSWKESAEALMLWVIVSATTVLYLVGHRTFEMLYNVLGDRFKGILMSDGYIVYRRWSNRLRCWPHLERKIVGLCDSIDGRVAEVGKQMFFLFKELMAAIYTARAASGAELPSQSHAKYIALLKRICEAYFDDPHEKLRALAREFLYDWDVIVRQLSEPHLPLSNNEAERTLRHWVISRLISHGTRTPTGSRAFALLASIIDTCHRRNVSAWHYLSSVIHAARHSLPLPALPIVPVTAGGV